MIDSDYLFIVTVGALNFSLCFGRVDLCRNLLVLKEMEVDS
jgi:hypothetical protein